MQAAHASLEYAYQHGRPHDHHPSLVHLTIRDKFQLEQLRVDLQDQGITTSEFHEPYAEWGLTAIACLVTEEQRHHLSHLQLWSAK
jgi:hypothetical protein